MAWARLGKIAWIVAVGSGTAGYAWHRLQAPPDFAVARISDELFARANQGGQLFGSGPDTVVVFSNYHCPYSADLFARLDSVLAERSHRFAVRFRHVGDPAGVSTSGSASHTVSLAAVCAAEQGRLREFDAWAFGHAEDLGVGFSPEIVPGTAGLNQDLFAACLRSARADSVVAGNMADAAFLGLEGTPTIITRRYRIAGSPPIDRIIELLGSSE